MSQLYIGIDVGKQGGICFLIDDKVMLFKTPLMAKEVDLKKFKSIFEDVIVNYGLVNSQIHCVIEDVHSIFGTSSKANFTFGYVAGITESIISFLDIPYTKVAPKKWQKDMWEGIKPVEINTGKKNAKGETKYKIDTKKTSLLAASKLFPGESFLPSSRCEVADDGLVDAALIALYCKRKFKI